MLSLKSRKVKRFSRKLVLILFFHVIIYFSKFSLFHWSDVYNVYIVQSKLFIPAFLSNSKTFIFNSESNLTHCPYCIAIASRIEKHISNLVSKYSSNGQKSVQYNQVVSLKWRKGLVSCVINACRGTAYQSFFGTLLIRSAIQACIPICLLFTFSPLSLSCFLLPYPP